MCVLCVRVLCVLCVCVGLCAYIVGDAELGVALVGLIVVGA